MDLIVAPVPKLGALNTKPEFERIAVFSLETACPYKAKSFNRWKSREASHLHIVLGQSFQEILYDFLDQFLRLVRSTKDFQWNFGAVPSRCVVLPK